MTEPEIQENFKQRFEKLIKEYRIKLPYQINEIRIKLDLAFTEKAPDESLSTALMLAHNLAGSAASFGFTEIGESSKDLENAIENIIQEDSLDKSSLGSLLPFFDSITYAFEASAMESFKKKSDESTDNVEVARLTSTEKGRVIYLVDNDDIARERLATQLNYFGFTIVSFGSIEEMKQSIMKRRPNVIICEVAFQDDDMAGTKALSSMREAMDGVAPVIFISGTSDFNLRLEAVRAGGYSFLDKPIDIATLVDKIGEIDEQSSEEPGRALIIEADHFLASYHRLILEQAGLAPEILHKPEELVVAFNDFAPELVLIDLYMPWCSGPEMAKVIRQMDENAGVPIVYLSHEKNIDKQLVAMAQGADDFLTKPIQPDHLILVVKTKIARYRSLRSHMARDSLTGLLNHTNFEGDLFREMARVKRHGSTLSFAIVDIDNFKSINDSYGHATGDRVIRSLARLLKERLRKTDFIGRIGGEEFGVVLIETDGPVALKVIADIKDRFNKLAFLSNDGEKFNATFSAGVSASLPGSDFSTIHSAADIGLYQAKKNGMNKAILI